MCKILSCICALLIILGGCSGKYKTKEDLFKQGTGLLASGNPDGAIVMLKNALERDRNYFDARLALARAYLAAGKLESAEKELRKLQRQRPNAREMQIEIARINGMKSSPDEALSDRGGFLTSNCNVDFIDKFPEKTGGYLFKDITLWHQKILRQAVETAPGNASLRYHLAFASLEQNTDALAIEQVRKAAKTADLPKDAQVKNGLLN